MSSLRTIGWVWKMGLIFFPSFYHGFFFLNIGLKCFNICFLKKYFLAQPLTGWASQCRFNLIWNQSKENKTLMCGRVNEPTACTNRCNTVTELKWNCLSLSLWNRVWSLQPCFSQNKVWITKCCDDFLLHRGLDFFRARQLQQYWEQWLCLWEVLKWKEPRKQV